MLKCHLSMINHSSITQFDDIVLLNHDFDRVAGADLHSVSAQDSRPDLSAFTDLNETYCSVFSQAQRQALRVTERSVGRFHRNRANSCPNLAYYAYRDLNGSLDNNSHYMTAYDRFQPLPNYLRRNQETQTETLQTLHVKDAGTQYGLPSDNSDSNDSDSDSEFEGIENITVAKQYVRHNSLSSEDLYTQSVHPNKHLRTSTPEEVDREN